MHVCAFFLICSHDTSLANAARGTGGGPKQRFSSSVSKTSSRRNSVRYSDCCVRFKCSMGSFKCLLVLELLLFDHNY